MYSPNVANEMLLLLFRQRGVVDRVEGAPRPEYGRAGLQELQLVRLLSHVRGLR